MGQGLAIASTIATTLIGGAAIFVFVIGLLASLGWRRLAADYATQAQPPATARRYSGQSLRFGSLFAPYYRSVINGWIAENGLYLRPGLFFRLFHPMLFIRWDQIETGELGRLLFWKSFKFTPRAPGALTVTLYGKVAEAAYEVWQNKTGPHQDK